MNKKQQRLSIKNLQLEPTGAKSEYSDFGLHLKNYVIAFTRTLRKERLCTPIDFLISQKKMKKRIERCCLLFKTPERILCALEDLRDLGFFINNREPVFMPILGLRRRYLHVAFDLDHVFLIDYMWLMGRMVSLSGFHTDYRGEIERLGKMQSARLVIDRKGRAFKKIERAVLMLEEKRLMQKSLFPQDWDWEKCVTSAMEALKNLLTLETKRVQEGLLVVHGLTQEMMVIRFIIEVETALVKTFYPSRELSKKYAKGD